MFLIDEQHEALGYRRRHRGLIGVTSKVPVRDRSMLSLVYTPGVAEACREISRNPLASFDLTTRGNTVAIITDGSDLFGFEADSPEVALPILESRSVIFKTFAGIDAFPICLDQRNPFDIIDTALSLTPTFGAICLDNIGAPHSFTIADHVEKGASIPVFSNQHHGTAILVLGALINALKVVNKRLEEVRVVVAGAGVSGIGVGRLLHRAGVRNLVICDRAGVVYPYRPMRMNWAKSYLAKETNPGQLKGSLADVLRGADVFIGLSKGNVLNGEMVKTMAPDCIVFAMANPTPEIMPEEAAPYVRVMATGRSDYPNQINNVLAFPGIFRGAIDANARRITTEMKLAAAAAIAGLVADPEPDLIVPNPFTPGVAEAVAEAVMAAVDA